MASRPLREREHMWHAERSFQWRLSRRIMFGDVLVGELTERLLLAARVLAEDRELRRLYRRRNADALQTSRLWAPGGQRALVRAFGSVVVRAHA